MDQYRAKLEETLGIQDKSAERKAELDLDRNSDASLESKLKEGDVAELKQIKELNEEKRRSARRKE